MAAAKKTTKTTTKKVETKDPSIVRKGALAYLGLYGFAAERAALRAEQVKGLYSKATDGLFEDLIARGENVEKLALGTVKSAQEKAVETFETTTDKVKSVKLPFGANDRVEELEAEVKALNKKIAALSKKAATPRKKAGINKEVMKTDKTAAKKAA